MVRSSCQSLSLIDQATKIDVSLKSLSAIDFTIFYNSFTMLLYTLLLFIKLVGQIGEIGHGW